MNGLTAWPFDLPGTPCQDAEFQQMTTEVQNGFKVLMGNGCPDHPMFLSTGVTSWMEEWMCTFMYSLFWFFCNNFYGKGETKNIKKCSKYVIADRGWPHFWTPRRWERRWALTCWWRRFLCDIFLLGCTHSNVCLVWDWRCVLKSPPDYDQLQFVCHFLFV